MDHEEELKLLKQTFPDVSCFCELCDCGRHRHHKDCKKVKRSKQGKFAPKTDYQATFRAYDNPKPRSSKRPPPRCLINPPPLDGATTQRTVHKPIDVEKHKRPPAFHQIQDYQAPEVAFDHKSSHQVDYYPRPIECTEPTLAMPGTFRLSDSGKFQTTTTNDEFFKTWGPDVKISFTEPPSFLGSLLFPSQKQEELQSVTRQSFPGVTADKIKPAKIPDGNIQLEGDHDHVTVHRAEYLGKPGKPSQRFKYNDQLERRRGKFRGETQTKYDFKDYGANSKRIPACPAPATISLKFNNKANFDTQNRVTYRGHDTRIHQAPPASRKDLQDYEPPKVSFETKTCNKVDYIPKDLNEASQPRAKMPESKMDFSGKFHSETAYNHYFQDRSPRRLPQRYGDFQEGINSLYLPPVQKFDATSTQKAEFIPPKNAEMRPNMKPKAEPISKMGSHDFSTVHRLTYTGEKPPLCKAELFLLQQELKRRLEEEGIDSPLAKTGNPICAK